MSTMTAPAFGLKAKVRRRINKARLNIDVIGLTVVNLFGPVLVGIPGLHLVLAIYPALATGTILTVDPSRFPEATTTRMKQRAAWRKTFLLAPVFVGLMELLDWSFHIPNTLGRLSAGMIVSSGLNAFFGELFWRNILQPKIRQTGISRGTSIGIQSLLFCTAWWIKSHSVGLTVMALFLGLTNGWISHRYRTILPGTLLYFGWNLCFTL